MKTTLKSFSERQVLSTLLWLYKRSYVLVEYFQFQVILNAALYTLTLYLKHQPEVLHIAPLN